MSTPDHSQRATSMKLLRRLAGQIASQRGTGDTTASLVATGQTAKSRPQATAPSPVGAVHLGNTDSPVCFGMD